MDRIVGNLLSLSCFLGVFAFMGSFSETYKSLTKEPKRNAVMLMAATIMTISCLMKTQSTKEFWVISTLAGLFMAMMIGIAIYINITWWRQEGRLEFGQRRSSAQ